MPTKPSTGRSGDPVAFISSTSDDLGEFRAAAEHAAKLAGFRPEMMEYFGASGRPSLEECLARVSGADVVVAISAHRYGWMPQDQPDGGNRSITWLECEHAAANGAEVLAFLVDNEAAWPDELRDKHRLDQAMAKGTATPALFADVNRDVGRLREFKAWLSTRPRVTFTTTEDLKTKVLDALHKWRQRHGEFPQIAPEPPDQSIPERYRDWIKNTFGSIDLLGLRLHKGQSVRIGSVYVPLTTSWRPPRVVEPERGRDEQASTALLQVLNERSLYVSGAPGSGKSTFCRWVAWLLADGTLSEHEGVGVAHGTEALREQFPEALRGKLPVLIRLRDFHDKLPGITTLTARQLEQALEHWLVARQPGGLRWSALGAQIDRGGAMILFDGVDEVPPTKRAALVSGLAELLPLWDARGTRCLLTGRPYGLAPGDVARLALPHAEVEELARPLQRLLVERWFRLLAEDVADGQVRAEQMQADLRARPELGPLAANPLLLTATCIVYSQSNQLPQHKHELYHRIVETVLHSRFPPEAIAAVRNELAVVAHGMHTGHGLDEARAVPASHTTDSEIGRMLEGYQQASVHVEKGFLEVSDTRDRLLSDSGLLLPTEETEASFYHLSLQEFLAAERMADLERDHLLAVLCERAARPEWRNTLSFLYGSQLANNVSPERAVELLVAFLRGLSAGASSGEVGVAADCIEILRGRGVTLRDEALAGFQTLCLAEMTGALPAAERAKFGRSLGIAGDPRFREDAWCLPEDPLLGFVEIPAGSFRMGSDTKVDSQASDTETPPHDVTLPAYYITRFPVTVAQFRAYAEHNDSPPEDPDSLRGPSNHPVVNVSWHEAVAYCRWLTGKLAAWDGTPDMIGRRLRGDGAERSWQVILPSEAEWEKAARGTDARIYSWGDKPDPDRANYDDTRIGTTSAVGCFPGGTSRPSILYLWVYAVQFLTGAVNREAPVDAHACLVAALLPRADLMLQLRQRADAPGETLGGERAQLVLGDVQPAAVLRGVMELEPLGQPPCLGRGKGLVERAAGVRIEVVEHHHHLLGVGVASRKERADLHRPVDLGAPRGRGHLPPARLGLGKQEEIRGPGAFILVIDPLGPPGGRWHRTAGLLDQLDRPLVHAHQRGGGGGRLLIHDEHVLHTGHIFAILRRRNHPADLDVRLQVVFFRAWRTVSWLIVSTTSSWINRSANRCSVHRARPAGGPLCATASSSRSPAGVSRRARGGCARGGRSRAAASPPSTSRRRMPCTVFGCTSKAAAAAGSVQAGPSSPASTLSSTWARARFCAATRLVLTTACNLARSSSVSRTTYRFSDMYPPLLSPFCPPL